MKEVEHKLAVLIYSSSGVMFTFMEVIDTALHKQDFANPLICALTIHYHSHLNEHAAKNPNPADGRIYILSLSMKGLDWYNSPQMSQSWNPQSRRNVEE